MEIKTNSGKEEKKQTFFFGKFDLVFNFEQKVKNIY